MEHVTNFQEFKIYKLTKNVAEKYLEDIVDALDLIPQVDKYTSDIVLSENKGDRILHAKWEHSLIALTDQNEFAGIVFGYEREKEGNNMYPENSIYLSDLAVSKNYQRKGLGKFLVHQWLEFNKKKGFLELAGPLKFSVQTNKEDWNAHVQRLYELLGFKKIAEKSYNNRVDNVYFLSL